MRTKSGSLYEYIHMNVYVCMNNSRAPEHGEVFECKMLLIIRKFAFICKNCLKYCLYLAFFCVWNCSYTWETFSWCGIAFHLSFKDAHFVNTSV